MRRVVGKRQNRPYSLISLLCHIRRGKAGKELTAESGGHPFLSAAF